MTLLLLRAVVAGIFLSAGLMKWSFWQTVPVGMSTVMVDLIKILSIVEPLGAAALFMGLGTRWVATSFALVMLGAMLLLHFTMQVGFFSMPQKVGLDYNALILVSSLALAAFGPGRWSLDAAARKV